MVPAVVSMYGARIPPKPEGMYSRSWKAKRGRPCESSIVLGVGWDVVWEWMDWGGLGRDVVENSRFGNN